MAKLIFGKKDFKIEWHSGTGPGGQHRNKTQNCCRITHLETGITTSGTEARSRVANEKAAFDRMKKLLTEYYNRPKDREISDEVIRTYHAERNEVIDKASDLRRPYKEVVLGADISEMLEARRKEIK